MSFYIIVLSNDYRPMSSWLKREKVAISAAIRGFLKESSLNWYCALYVLHPLFVSNVMFSYDILETLKFLHPYIPRIAKKHFPKADWCFMTQGVIQRSSKFRVQLSQSVFRAF